MSLSDSIFLFLVMGLDWNCCVAQQMLTRDLCSLVYVGPPCLRFRAGWIPSLVDAFSILVASFQIIYLYNKYMYIYIYILAVSFFPFRSCWGGVLKCWHATGILCTIIGLAVRHKKWAVPLGRMKFDFKSQKPTFCSGLCSSYVARNPARMFTEVPEANSEQRSFFCPRVRDRPFWSDLGKALNPEWMCRLGHNDQMANIISARNGCGSTKTSLFAHGRRSQL